MSIQSNQERLKEALLPGTKITSHTGEVFLVSRTTDQHCVLGMEPYTWRRIEQLVRIKAFKIQTQTQTL